MASSSSTAHSIFAPVLEKAKPKLKPKLVPPPKAESTPVEIGEYITDLKPPAWTEKAARVRTFLHKDRRNLPKEVLKNCPTPGLPPAPIDTYVDPKAVARHAYQWDPSTTITASFVPDRHTMMINDRPMQTTVCL